jgi:hypothetical protein
MSNNPAFQSAQTLAVRRLAQQPETEPNNAGPALNLKKWCRENSASGPFRWSMIAEWCGASSCDVAEEGRMMTESMFPDGIVYVDGPGPNVSVA